MQEIFKTPKIINLIDQNDQEEEKRIWVLPQKNWHRHDRGVDAVDVVEIFLIDVTPQEQRIS